MSRLVTEALPLFDFSPWMRIVWLCARRHVIPGAVYREAPFLGAPDESLGIRCDVCGARAAQSAEVPTRFHDDPPWAWPPGTECPCATCRSKRGRCTRALRALLTGETS